MQSNTLASLFRPMMTRLRGLARRGTIARVDETQKMRAVQIRAGARDTRDRVEHWEPYGFTSSPLNDAEALIINIGADRAHSAAIVVSDRRHRPLGLHPGDVAVFAANGAKVILRNGGGIEITSSIAITITAPELRVNGDIKATGNVSDLTRSMAADRELFNAHTHAGVSTGSGTTAPPLPHQ